MKIRSIITYTATAAALAGTPLLMQRVQAGPVPVLGQVSLQFGRQQEPPPPPRYRPSWNEDQSKELRHIYFRLEHANNDYDGHRANAMREIRRAAEDMGFDLRGAGYQQQGDQSGSQEWSDSILRRSKDRLSELASMTEQPVRHELFNAVRELDKALDVRGDR